MKVKLIRKVLLGLTFISGVITTSVIIWKIVQSNNLDVESRSNNKIYKTVKVAKQDIHKVVEYRDNTYLFDLPNLEYYLVNKTLNFYPELSNKTFNFKANDYRRPKKVEMSISTTKELTWFYSII